MHLAYLHYLCGDDTALNHAQQFAKAARQLGHSVEVHAMNPVHSGDDESSGSSIRARLRRTLKKRFSRYLHDPKEFLWNFRHYRRELALLQDPLPDVLLVRDQTQVVSCVPVARKLGLPLVLEFNSPVEDLRYNKQYLHLKSLHEIAVRWKLHHADEVTVVSSALKEHFVKRYGLDRQMITVVPNGADVESFHPEREADPEYPRDPSHPRIGFVGSFQQFHGLELLSSMIGEVSRICPEVRFLLVGGGAGAEQVAAATRGNDRVAFTGRVPHDRVPGLVASFDIGVMPESLSYGCPLKVVEWMAAGRAVVAPRHQSSLEILDDGREGLLFTPGDLNSFVETVVALVKQPDLRARLGAAAAERARTSLTWRRNAERVLEACSRARARHGAIGRAGSKGA